MKPNRTHKRTQEQIISDRAKIANLYLQEYSYRQITDILNGENPYSLSVTQIANDITTIVKEWQIEKSSCIDSRIDIDLQKIDKLEHEAWLAWERSKGYRVLKTSSKTAKEKTRSIRRETQNGNPKYLEIILKCIHDRGNILGYMAPVKIDTTVSISVTNKVSEMTAEEIRKEIDKLRGLELS